MSNSVIGVAVVLMLWLPGNRPWLQAQTQECVAPRYTLGPLSFDLTRDGWRIMTIAIAEEAFTRAALRCLAGALAREQGSARAVGVMIFDSKRAADRYSGPGSAREILSHLHARYVKDEAGQYSVFESDRIGRRWVVRKPSEPSRRSSRRLPPVDQEPMLDDHGPFVQALCHARNRSRTDTADRGTRSRWPAAPRRHRQSRTLWHGSAIR